MILLMTSQHYIHRCYNLILALQLYVKRSYTTLYPEKNQYVYSTTEYTNNNREKNVGGGGNRLN